MKYLQLYESYNKSYTIQDWYDKHNYSTPLKIDHLCIEEKRKLTSLKGVEQFENLEFLMCADNKLTSIKELEYLTKLQELYVGYNQIKNLEGIENLINLKHLYIHRNELKNLNGVENLTNLTNLCFAENNLTHVNEIKNIVNLKLLFCENNKIKNLDIIENLPDITDFKCIGNPLECPFPLKVFNRFSEYRKNNEIYDKKNIEYFKTYESQKIFIKKHPENIKELEIYGFHEKIKEEFADLIEGSEFGFFNLR